MSLLGLESLRARIAEAVWGKGRLPSRQLMQQARREVRALLGEVRLELQKRGRSERDIKRATQRLAERHPHAP